MAGLGEQRRRINAAISLLTCVLMLATAVALLLWVDRGQAPGAFGVYLPGNWPVPFGIVLAVDRLAALMLVLAALFCTVLGHHALQPMMEAARAGQGRWSFGALHAASTAFYGIKTLCVAALAWRAARP